MGSVTRKLYDAEKKLTRIGTHLARPLSVTINYSASGRQLKWVWGFSAVSSGVTYCSLLTCLRQTTLHVTELTKRCLQIGFDSRDGRYVAIAFANIPRDTNTGFGTRWVSSTTRYGSKFIF